MSEPRRLSKSGGVSQRLLDSASLDKPSQASRRKVAGFAATASSFARTNPRASAAPLSRTSRPSSSVAKTLATWTLIGAAASATLALVGSKLFDASGQLHTMHHAAGPAMAELPPAPTRSPDISPEPAAVAHDAPLIAPTPPQPVNPTIEPWVPSPITNEKPGAASFDEVRDIEGARAAVSRGDDSAAIAQLNDYDRNHPSGALKPESMVLRIQALSNSGKASEARTLANEFQGKYPQHALLQKVARNVPK
jgi:hypothetical protein